MVGEQLGRFAAAKRNWRLVKLRYGLCVVFVLFATLLSALLLLGIATLVPLLSEFGFLALGGAAWIVQSVMVQLAVLVVVPLIGLGTAQAYLEVRLAGEGLDLQIDAERAFGPASSEAVRCQYRALIGDLARSGYVDEIPGRTSGEERQQVAEIAPRLGELGRDVARQFDVAADTFDEAWFDDSEVTTGDDKRFLAAEQAVLDVVLTGVGKRDGREVGRDAVTT
jgi:hypothetical protein